MVPHPTRVGLSSIDPDRSIPGVVYLLGLYHIEIA
jgi:hypothetical protein